MRHAQKSPFTGNKAGSNRPRWLWLLAGGFALAMLLFLLLPHASDPSAKAGDNASTGSQTKYSGSSLDTAHNSSVHRPSTSDPTVTAEEIVAGKVNQFARDRLKIMQAMAKRFKVEVPHDVERFFAAVAEGGWEDSKAAYDSLWKRRESGKDQDLNVLWGPILETELIAECAHDWPAQKLLDYGQSILGSLKPGMVYVGGTDPGRGIPTLLNETSDGERHIVITQNALANNSYVDYVNFLYADQMAPLTPEDSQRAFQDYLTDAQKRLTHDQQFPDEPKQVRAGEDIQMIDGRPHVSGQIAVMAINEKLLQTIMEKNPGLSFGLEESFPFKSTYPNAIPAGPIMQLGVPDVQTAFTSDTAAQAVDYWKTTAQDLLSDPQTPDGSDPRKAYAKMAAAQAGLLAEHNFSQEAEQAYRVAMEISPSSPEVVYGLAELLANTGRADEARKLVETVAH